MKKIKGLILATVVMLALLFSGCDLLHRHNFVQKFNDTEHFCECICGEVESKEDHKLLWKNGNDPEHASYECEVCGKIFDLSVFNHPINIKSRLDEDSSLHRKVLPSELKTRSRESFFWRPAGRQASNPK